MGGNAASPFYQVSRSLLHTLEVFVTGTRMNLRSIQGAEIKVAAASSPKHIAERTLILHAIKQAKAIYILRRGVPLPLAAFSDRGFVQLAVVSSHILDLIPRAI